MLHCLWNGNWTKNGPLYMLFHNFNLYTDFTNSFQTGPVLYIIKVTEPPTFNNSSDKISLSKLRIL